MNNYTGVIIEPRIHSNLIKVINKFYNYLIDSASKLAHDALLAESASRSNWKIIFYCGKNLKTYWINKLPNIEIRELEVNNLTYCEYSDLLKSLEFWENIKSKYILIFQTDTWICSNNNMDIYKFIKYDFIGGYAPQNWWSNQLPTFNTIPKIQCFNGGLSLRNREAMINAVKTFAPKKTENFKDSNKDFTTYHEDLYFINCLYKLNYKLPIDINAINFCTHSKFVTNTFGTHKFYKYIKNDELYKFIKEYPEVINIYPT
jgi:hypothetical protein